MAEENPKIPLAPPRNQYPRSDEAAVKSSHGKSSKSLVYVLATTVTLSASLLIFASIFLRANTPDVKLESVAVKNLRHGNGTTPSPASFNVTLVTELTIENKNFGYFEFQNCSGSVLYGSVTVGDVKIRNGRVEAREMERMNVTVDVRLNGGNSDGKNLSTDLNTGILKLNSYAKLHGKVNLMNVLKKTKTPQLDCSMNLVLASNKVEDLVCS